MTRINLDNGCVIPELTRLQEHFQEYKIIVYSALHPDDVMFEGTVESSKRLKILYDDINRHCHVIVNLTGVVAKDTFVEIAIRVVIAKSAMFATTI